ncbi:Ig-like domain-containing protein [Flavilitoribacter nigricans]|uniref:Ig-like domain-containing protein n=1 Tax=Flavilitoribacter nigricans TaxID=70997 RepID=UPI001473F224|nr:Ig-like domain-containing protein [Flavilitoribacter nigricans]
MIRTLRLVTISGLIWLLHSCATPTAPQGGPRDETPPQIVEEESTPNLQTNFEKQTIELTFDEWVTLEQVRDEVIISPPLPADPEIKLKKRTVQVIFPDTIDLRENVTYTINFGEAVKDLNEKNPADDLRFVFSTGPYIDSLRISGSIVDVQTGEPVEKVLFMLYDNLADSVVYTERPFYFGKTGEDGRFEINNIREGTYKGFALNDSPQGKKYIFEPLYEALAFPGEEITITADTTFDLELKLFQEATPLLATTLDTSHSGKAKIIFNQPIFDLELAYDNLVDTPLIKQQGDSLILWYTQTTPWTLYLNQDTVFRDTFSIRAGRRAAMLSQDSMATVRTTAANQSIVPGTPPVLRYNHPVGSFDTSLITLYVDTLRQAVRPGVQIDPENFQQLQLDYSWRENMLYELELLPGAVTDIYGLTTSDTLTVNYSLDALSRYGNIVLTLSNLDTAEQYLVQLLTKDLKQTLLTDEVTGVSTYETTWTTIKPSDYTLRVITDWNGNGRWDTGNYDTGLQPEPIYLRPLEKLRANWDLDATVVYGEVIAAPEPPESETNSNQRPGDIPNGRRGGRN